MAHTKPIYFTLLLLFFTAFSCTSQKQVSSPDEWKGNFIRFGKGGGFTGVSDVYVLLENGQLFAKQGWSNSFKKLESVNKKTAADVFKQAAAISFPSSDVNEPGNLFKELQIVLKGKKINLVWSDGNPSINQEFNALHQKLFSLIKN
jgi:hypothetical protein